MTDPITIRQPIIKQDFFCMCESCMSWEPLPPPDKKGNRSTPLRLDPIAFNNDRNNQVWICARCWQSKRYDSIQRKIEGNKIVEYVPDLDLEPEPKRTSKSRKKRRDK